MLIKVAGTSNNVCYYSEQLVFMFILYNCLQFLYLQFFLFFGQYILEVRLLCYLYFFTWQTEMDFEQACEPNRQNGSMPTYHKYALRRVEPSLRKFIKVLHIDLERLKHHKTNIEKVWIFIWWHKIHIVLNCCLVVNKFW